MSRFRYQDIVIELIDLSKMYIEEINQQLVYFKASVYKNDLDVQIKESIESLRTISKLVPDQCLADAMSDYDSEGFHSFNSQVLDGGLIARTERLIDKFEKRFECIELGGLNIIFSNNSRLREYERTLRHKKEELLSVAKQNTKQWNMFKNI